MSLKSCYTTYQKSHSDQATDMEMGVEKTRERKTEKVKKGKDMNRALS